MLDEFNKAIFFVLGTIVLAQFIFFLMAKKKMLKLKETNFNEEYDEHKGDLNYIEKLIDSKISVSEENIQIYMNIPLYLGLCGTIICIVIGLIFDMNIINDENIKNIIKEIAFAMIASFFGIFYTIVNSCIFTGTAECVEQRKKGYLKKLSEQIENEKNKENNRYKEAIRDIADSVTSKLASSLSGLTANLTTFNSEFKENTKSFKTSMDKFNKDILNIDRITIENNAIVTKCHKAMNEIIKQIDSSVENMKKLSSESDGFINKLIETTDKLVDATKSTIGSRSRELQDSIIEAKKNLEDTWENTKKNLQDANNTFMENVKDSLTGMDRKLSEDNNNLKIKLQYILETNKEAAKNTQDSLTDIKNDLSKECEDLRTKLQNIAKTNKEKTEEVLENIESDFSKECGDLRTTLQNIAKTNLEKAEEFLRNINATFSLEDLNSFVETSKTIKNLNKSYSSLEDKITEVVTEIENLNDNFKNIKTTIDKTNDDIQELKLNFFKKIFKWLRGLFKNEKTSF